MMVNPFSFFSLIFYFGWLYCFILYVKVIQNKQNHLIVSGVMIFMSLSRLYHSVKGLSLVAHIVSSYHLSSQRNIVFHFQLNEAAVKYRMFTMIKLDRIVTVSTEQ